MDVFFGLTPYLIMDHHMWSLQRITMIFVMVLCVLALWWITRTAQLHVDVSSVLICRADVELWS